MIRDTDKSKSQLIEELKQARAQISQLESGSAPMYPVDMYRLLAENPSVGIYIIQNGLLVYVNRCFAHFFEFPQEEIIGKLSIDRLIFKDDLPMIEEVINDRMMGIQSTENTPIRVIKKDGTLFHVDCYVVRTEFHGGPALIGLVLERTGLIWAEEALRENEMLFSSLLKHSPIYIFFKDKDMRTLRLSDNYEQMLGMPVGDALGKTMDDLFPSELARSMVEDDKRILKSGEILRIEETLGDAEFDTIKFPIFKDGVPSVLAGFTIDISEQKRAKEALRVANGIKEKLISEVPAGLALYDVDTGKCIATNKAIADLVGGTVESVYSYGLYETESWRELGILEKAQNAIEEGVKKDIYIEGHRLKGNEQFLQCFLVPFSEGDKNYLLVTINDLTESKQMEERIRQIEKLQAIGQLAGGISHDFNNQLAGIVGYADLLSEELKDNPVLSQYVEKIFLTSKRASDLTSQLLAYARRGKKLSVIIDIHSIIDEVMELVKRTIDKRIVLEAHCQASAPLTQGDPTQIQSAILNLVLNARDAMKRGGNLIITTSNLEICESMCKKDPSYQMNPGRFLLISVADNGEGMDENTKRKIFEPFFTTKEQGKGTGMGLASTYGTIKNHGGSIVVDSEPGKGTTVNVYLPQAKP